MYRCLCASIIITVIILIGVLSELGKYIDEDGNEILSSQNLRGMYIDIIVDEIFTNIYDSVITSAAKGKTTGSFTIMCIKSQDPNGAKKNYYGDDNSYSCDNYDGYKLWWIYKNRRNGDEPLPKNDQSEKIKMRVIKKIQTTFPDSNITSSYKNCCDQYKITW